MIFKLFGECMINSWLLSFLYMFNHKQYNVVLVTVTCHCSFQENLLFQVAKNSPIFWIFENGVGRRQSFKSPFNLKPIGKSIDNDQTDHRFARYIYS